MRRITFRGAVSAALLTLIALYGISSSGNIILLVSMFHESWVAWTLGGGLGFTLVITSFVAATARTRKLFCSAILIAMAAGLMSASFQTFIYLEDGAPAIIAYVLGFGIPLIGEVGLALLDAHYREEHETWTDGHRSTQLSAELSEVRDALQRALTDMTDVQGELERTSQALQDAKAELAEQDRKLQAQARETQAQAVRMTQKSQPKPSVVTDIDARRVNDAQVELIRVIAQDPRLQQKDIADKMDMSESAVSRRLKPLKDGGLVEFNGNSWDIHPQLISQLNGRLQSANA